MQEYLVEMELHIFVYEKEWPLQLLYECKIVYFESVLFYIKEY